VQTTDDEIWSCVALQNEYDLPDSFAARDIILDVGAHTGSFVKACHERGSRAIHAFEPHAENFQLALSNVGALEGVSLYEGAVLEKARSARLGRFARTIPKENTGAVMVLNEPGGVNGYAIDTLLEQLDFVKLMKLDCEGGEWPILEHLKQWQRLGAVCGEYHATQFDPVLRLRSILNKRFPLVRIENPNEEGLGKFWASHIRMFQCDADTGHHAKHSRREIGRVPV
jgi:FkbM family methyltransferase